MEVELWQRPPTRRAEDPLPPRPTTHRSTLAACSHATARGMTSLARLDTMRRMHRQHSGAAPTGNTTLPAARSTSSERSRLRTDTPLNPNGPAPQAVDGRIMSVLKQHLHVTQERYATPHGTRPPTHLLEHQPIDAAFGARIDPYQCHGKAHQSPSTTDSGRTEAGGPLGPHVCNAQRRGSGHNPDPAKARERRGNTYNELLKLLPELCTPVTTIVGLPTTTNVAWDGTDTGHSNGLAHRHPHHLQPNGRTGPVWTLAGTAGLAVHWGMRCNARPRPHEGVLRNAAEQHKTPRHVGKASPARATTMGGGILCMTKDFRAARERQQLEPTAAPPTTEHDWPEGLGTDRPRPAPLPPVGRPHYTDASRRRVKLPCGRAVIRLGAAVYTPHDGHHVRTVDPGHNPDGDTANHAELVAIHAAIADAEVDQPPQSSRIARRPSTRSST
jgi:hypothetical protein